jgi:hypothetical protein
MLQKKICYLRKTVHPMKPKKKKKKLPRVLKAGYRRAKAEPTGTRHEGGSFLASRGGGSCISAQ